MLSWPPSVRIFIAASPADMRRGFDGLARMTTEVIRQDPLCCALFVFRNRRGDRIKVLYWAGDGFTLWYRRLEQGTFRFPACECYAAEIRAVDLTMILEGIGLSTTRRRPRYARPTLATAEVKSLDDAGRLALRSERSAPLLERHGNWLEEQSRNVLPKSPIGAAIGYARSNRAALNRFTEVG
jgi:transposase